MTPETWHVTRDMWHMVGGEHYPQLFWFGIDSVLKILNKRITDSVNKWNNDKDVFRTAPATLGLINIWSIQHWLNSPIDNPTLYMAVTFEPIMQFSRLWFEMFITIWSFCLCFRFCLTLTGWVKKTNISEDQCKEDQYQWRPMQRRPIARLCTRRPTAAIPCTSLTW